MRVGRPSELDVVGEAPRAAGGRRALRAGRRQLHESLDVENKKLSKGPVAVHWFADRRVVSRRWRAA